MILKIAEAFMAAASLLLILLVISYALTGRWFFLFGRGQDRSLRF